MAANDSSALTMPPPTHIPEIDTVEKGPSLERKESTEHDGIIFTRDPTIADLKRMIKVARAKSDALEQLLKVHEGRENSVESANAWADLHFDNDQLLFEAPVLPFTKDSYEERDEAGEDARKRTNQGTLSTHQQTKADVMGRIKRATEGIERIEAAIGEV